MFQDAISQDDQAKLSQLDGYRISHDFLATQFTQGGRSHYSVVMPLRMATQFFEMPDPDRPFEDNRVVSSSQANGFKDYVLERASLERDGWHCGTLTIRTTTGVASFSEIISADGVPPVGALTVPIGRRDEFRIVDGQHRLLGLHRMFQQLDKQLREFQQRVRGATASGQKSAAKRATAELEKHKALMKRLEAESVAVDLIIEDQNDTARQIFSDVAMNAKGVSKAVQARFDGTRISNRVVKQLMSRPPSLLDGRIDEQGDRTVGNNPNVLGAGTLGEIVRLLERGSANKLSKTVERDLTAGGAESRMLRQANDFFAAMTSAFPELEQVAEGNLAPGDLRKQSLLGSVIMWKVLAGVSYNVRRAHSAKAFEDLLGKLAPHMTAPIDGSTVSGKLWLGCGSHGAFVEGKLAPGGRAQEVVDLIETISNWVTNPPAALTTP